MTIKIITREQAKFLIQTDMRSVSVYGTYGDSAGELLDEVYDPKSVDEYKLLFMVEK